MPRRRLHMRSDRKRGFAQTKIIITFGIFIVIIGILSLISDNIINNAELDLKNTDEGIQFGIGSETVSEDVKPENSESLSGKRLSLAPNEMSTFRVRPIFEGYRSTGLEIWWLRNDSVLVKLGLQKNDIIKSINGTEMQNVGDLMNAIYMGTSKPRFDIEIIRNSKALVITYIVE